jgi:FtsP/CotA-like multicopper oxidase with cupredoxin domain
MTATLAVPLAPFADALPVPQRLVAARQNGRLSVPIRAGAHRFHRDLPESAVWGYDGTVPGPTIEAERGQPVTVQWRNELDGALPVAVTTAPVAADTSGVPGDGLVLASAERADLLVDFSGLKPGSELTLVNTAAAPFDGAPFPAANARNAADPDRILPYPHVMGFRVVPGPVTRPAISGELATDYRLPAPDTLAGAPRRTIALVERELDGEPNMLTMRELVIADDHHTGPVVTVTDDQQTTRYRAVAAHFEDATTFFPVLGRYEVWQLINLTGDTHPIHVHLDPFQILSRRPIRYQIPQHGIEDLAITAAVTLDRDPGDGLEHTIDDNERGLKDTVRVNPHEIAEIAVRFTTYSGRYMYHCHILEHEDRDMMRPFVTMPAELMPFMA